MSWLKIFSMKKKLSGCRQVQIRRCSNGRLLWSLSVFVLEWGQDLTWRYKWYAIHLKKRKLCYTTCTSLEKHKNHSKQRQSHYLSQISSLIIAGVCPLGGIWGEGHQTHRQTICGKNLGDIYFCLVSPITWSGLSQNLKRDFLLGLGMFLGFLAYMDFFVFQLIIFLSYVLLTLLI